MIDRDLETIHTVVPSYVKEKVAQIVKEGGITIEDFVKYCIKKELKARGLLQYSLFVLNADTNKFNYTNRCIKHRCLSKINTQRFFVISIKFSGVKTKRLLLQKPFCDI